VFILEVVERSPRFLYQVPSNLQHDKDVILAACTKEREAAALGAWWGICFPPHLLRDKHFIETAVDLGQVGFLERAFRQHPELCEDHHLLQHIFTSMGTVYATLEHPVFDARWLRGPMKSLWDRMVASYRAEENLSELGKSALELRRARARTAQFRKRARMAQQKARVSQTRSKQINSRGGRHKTTYVEDWFL